MPRTNNYYLRLVAQDGLDFPPITYTIKKERACTLILSENGWLDYMDNNQIFQEICVLDAENAQEIFDRLWQYGLRPTNEKETTSQESPTL